MLKFSACLEANFQATKSYQSFSRVIPALSLLTVKRIKFSWQLTVSVFKDILLSHLISYSPFHWEALPNLQGDLALSSILPRELRAQV